MKELSAPVPADVAGWLLPWRLDQDQPWLFTLEGTDWLPVFSTELKLRGAMARAGVPEHAYRAKQITETGDFVRSAVEGGVRVMADPWVTPEGNTRFTEIRLPGGPNP